MDDDDDDDDEDDDDDDDVFHAVSVRLTKLLRILKIIMKSVNTMMKKKKKKMMTKKKMEKSIGTRPKKKIGRPCAEGGHQVGDIVFLLRNMTGVLS